MGDVVRLESDDFIPADMLVITSSEPEGLCYIETSNLDGYVLIIFKWSDRIHNPGQRDQSQNQAGSNTHRLLNLTIACFISPRIAAL